MKFGGTSVADGARVRHVAELAKKHRDSGNEIVIMPRSPLRRFLLDIAKAIGLRLSTFLNFFWSLAPSLH